MADEPTNEAGKPRPLREHMERAEACWERLAEFVRGRAADPNRGLVKTQLDTLRQAAGIGYWLYPLVEGKRGIPR